ncbi:MAG TPA: hypothetical protein VJH87_14365 [Vicinamibacteria bacterium]|nr:hypothetical protein [Vicinamibacteria bacterium]
MRREASAGRPAVRSCLVVQAGQEKPGHVLGLTGANAHTSRIGVDELPSMLCRLVEAEESREAHGPRKKVRRARLSASRENESQDLERRDGEKDVARSNSPILVLDHGVPGAGNSLHRSMGCDPGLRRGHRQSGAEEEQHRSRRPGEGDPAGQREQPEDDAHDQERDREMDHLGVKRAHRVTHAIVLPGARRARRPGEILSRFLPRSGILLSRWPNLRLAVSPDELLMEAIRFFDQQDVAPLVTGANWSEELEVLPSAVPLQITLAWTDPPAASGATSPLPNDLKRRIPLEPIGR